MMTEPMDFSKVGTTKPAQAPKKAPGRRGAGGRSAKRLLLALLAIGAVGIAAFIVLGGDDDPAGDAAKAAEYCSLATEFDRVVNIPDPSAGPADTSATALAGALRQLGGTVGEMTSDAPSEIRSEVKAIVDAVKEGADGKPAAVKSEAYQGHARRVATYRAQFCGAGAGTVGD